MPWMMPDQIRAAKEASAVNRLRDTSGHLLTCRIVIGEVLAFVAKAQAKGTPWGKAKLETLERLLEALHIIEIAYPAIAKNYAELCAFSEVIAKPMRIMSGSDLWIAAAAKASGATRLTSDSDFDHLHPLHITVEKYEPRMTSQE